MEKGSPKTVITDGPEARFPRAARQHHPGYKIPDVPPQTLPNLTNRPFQLTKNCISSFFKPDNTKSLVICEWMIQRWNVFNENKSSTSNSLKGKNDNMAAAKKTAKKVVPTEAGEASPKKRRGRSSLSISVPINKSTQSILETCVTLRQATSTEAVAAKLLAKAADELRATMTAQISGSFTTKEKA